VASFRKFYPFFFRETKQEPDLYIHWKTLEKELEYLKEQEGYIKFEIKHLRHELLHAQKEIKRIQAVPLLIGQVT
jgi:26S proteasome regulatory subunit T3